MKPRETFRAASILAFIACLSGLAMKSGGVLGQNRSSATKPAPFHSLKPAAAATPVPVEEPRLDLYGGVPVKVAEPASTFRVKKVGDRWMFVTPKGNDFWMLGVYAVDSQDSKDDQGGTYEQRIAAKYGDKYTWARQTVKRLRNWGFNTIGEYSTWYVLPTKSPYTDWSNPERMAFVALIRPSYYGLTNHDHYAAGPVKDLISGTDPAIYTDWRGSTIPDVFDPNFAAYVDGCVKALTSPVLESPWLIGITSDDADDLFGFGPGPEVPAARRSPQIGWLVLTGNPQQNSNSKLNVTYSDTKVYSKYALRDFLRKRYSTILALNASWNSAYSTWDSDGGWPSGKGFLDESGRSRWVGRDSVLLANASPNVRADLDAFLYEFAKQYFSVTAEAIRKYAPGHLVFGPASLNGWGGLTRGPILRAAGESVDVLQANISSQRVLDLTERYAGDKPIVTWEAMPANSDSSLWRYPNPADGFTLSKTQNERGQTYAQRTAYLYEAKTAGGTHPICGLKFWAYADSWSEKTNWGLVTFSDNAYDGKEDSHSSGSDAWGFRVGGEEHDYGDFISPVRDANLRLVHAIQGIELGDRSQTAKAGGVAKR